jgi:hypothetical protein
MNERKGRKMKKKATFIKFVGIGLVAVGIAWALVPQIGRAHCDTLDGPVVMAARAAMDSGNIAPVLKWVHKPDEDAIKDAFAKTLGVRKLSPQAKQLADMYFFETLVRLHRAAEGAPFTGLKPAGEVEPVVAAADKAIESGSLDDLAKEISTLVRNGMHQRFDRVVKTRKEMDQSTEAGREYVEAYVEFVHYVECLHNDALGAAAHDAGSDEKSPSVEHVH